MCLLGDKRAYQPTLCRLTACNDVTVGPGPWLAEIPDIMTDLLRATPMLVVPSWSARFAAGLTGAAIALAVLGSRSMPADMKRLALASNAAATSMPASISTSMMPASVLSTAVSVPPVGPSELLHEGGKSAYFVFEINGTSYLRLDDFEGAPRTRAPLQLSQRGDTFFASAPLGLDEVPASYRGWLGRQVIADERCSARVSGFAVVSQLVGDPVYADGMDDAKLGPDWTAEAVRDHGHRMIVARLDGCGGSSLARDAAAPRFEIPAAVSSPDSAKLIEAAQRAVLTSKTAAQAQVRWSEGGGEGRWQDQAHFDARVLRHHGTKATWVVVFANNQADDCGVPEVNLLATFKVGPGGALRPVTQRLVEELHELDVVLDSDGDGQLEMLGKPWLGFDRLLTDPRGEVVDRLEVPFFGCPC